MAPIPIVMVEGMLPIANKVNPKAPKNSAVRLSAIDVTLASWYLCSAFAGIVTAPELF